MAVIVVASSLVLMCAGYLVAAVSRPIAHHGIAGWAVMVLGGGALEALRQGVPAEWLLWPMLALSAGAVWLVFVPHRRQSLRRWSVTGRGGLDS